MTHAENPRSARQLIRGVPTRLQSKRVGRVSCCGDAMMRSLLYEAAQVLLANVKKWSWLKAWAMNIAAAGKGRL